MILNNNLARSELIVAKEEEKLFYELAIVVAIYRWSFFCHKPVSRSFFLQSLSFFSHRSKNIKIFLPSRCVFDSETKSLIFLFRSSEQVVCIVFSPTAVSRCSALYSAAAVF